MVHLQMGWLPLAQHFPSQFRCVRHRLMGNGLDCGMGYMQMGSSILSHHIFSHLRPFQIYHNPNHLHASLWLRVWVCLHRRCSQLGATRMGTEQLIRVLWLFRTFLITCSRGPPLFITILLPNIPTHLLFVLVSLSAFQRIWS